MLSFSWLDLIPIYAAKKKAGRPVHSYFYIYLASLAYMYIF